jgi:hypothetical protein
VPAGACAVLGGRGCAGFGHGSRQPYRHRHQPGQSYG